MRLGRAPRRRGGHRRWRQARRRWERLHVTHYRATRRPICHCALYGCRHGPSTAARTHGPLWVWRRAAPLLESRQPGPLLCAYIRYGKLGRACQRSTYLLLHICMHAAKCGSMNIAVSVRFFLTPHTATVHRGPSTVLRAHRAARAIRSARRPAPRPPPRAGAAGPLECVRRVAHICTTYQSRSY